MTLTLQAVVGWMKTARAAMRALERSELTSLEARVAELEGRA